jgi:hypothetical protein
VCGVLILKWGLCGWTMPSLVGGVMIDAACFGLFWKHKVARDGVEHLRRGIGVSHSLHGEWIGS